MRGLVAAAVADGLVRRVSSGGLGRAAELGRQAAAFAAAGDLAIVYRITVVVLAAQARRVASAARTVAARPRPEP